MKIFKIPRVDSSIGCSFDYNGIRYKVSKLRKLYVDDTTYAVDISWQNEVLIGVVLHQGQNLVKQFGRCEIPALFAVFGEEYEQDDMGHPLINLFIRE